MMKVGRRGFLGLMAGGVAAGPKLASDFAGGVARQGSFVGYASSAGSQLMPPSEGDWKASRIADLRNWLSGSAAPEEEHYRRNRIWQQVDERDRYRIDALRSVAMVHKHRMFHAGEEARQEYRKRIQWEFELSQLTGGLL